MPFITKIHQFALNIPLYMLNSKKTKQNICFCRIKNIYLLKYFIGFVPFCRNLCWGWSHPAPTSFVFYCI